MGIETHYERGMAMENTATVKAPGTRATNRAHYGNRIRVECMECGTKFATLSKLPTCPGCKGCDIELR